MSGIDARRIREALIDPAGVARLLGIQTRARAGRHSIDVRCPFHDDSAPSLSLFVGPRDGQLGFACKAAGCAVRGDVLTLIALRNNLSTTRPEDFRKVLEIGDALAGGVGMAPIVHREVKPANPPTSAALRGVLAKCAPAAKDAAVTSWLRGRGIDAAAVDDLAFALPAGTGGLPRFAAPWPHTGHRLLLPAYDAQGNLATLRARSVDGAQPKSRAPRGGPTAGVVLANAGGLAILRGDAGAPERALVCEGEPDMMSAPANDIAVFAVTSEDSWSPYVGRALWGRDVTMALHDDTAGDVYAASVLRSVSGRSVVRDMFATGRAARASGAGGKGLFDLNELLLDGADIAAMVRDAPVVLDPESAAFVAQEPGEDASSEAATAASASTPSEAAERATAGALAALDGRDWICLNDRDAAVLRVLVRMAWWHGGTGPDGVRVGESFPAVATVARKAEMAIETARRALAALERWGAISRTRRVTDDRGLDRTYLYRLCDRLIEAGSSCRER